ncbi:hypothetical protein OHT59_40130 [Streptomyces sp. NBC_00243]|uniref:hypothetical protein n=1 Tax=Streptomyces sp. NBC_00243 TaxID=2975688 RepID=UPI002DD7C66D|nr:hypothetical protein [Streptomyces sp. NBC_00243]WRZ24284.1 hypothetical protein OHT59_40130 [Streptomyces sp. NBC_00243]
MTEAQPPVQIHIVRPEDEGYGDLTDVGLANIRGERHLFLKPQTFDSAVRQVSSTMPDLPLEHVERLLREYCPEFRDFDELLGPVGSHPLLDITPTRAEPDRLARPRGRAKRWVIATALVPALAGSWALGYVTGSSPVGTVASTPDASANDAVGAQVATKPFTGPEFLDFSTAGRIDCKPIADLEAECTDADGMVMSSTAAAGPDSTIFTFSYGSERIGLRIFGDAEYAETWARQDGTTELYPNLARSGRYVLWGTDEQRLSAYADLLRAQGPRPSSTTSTVGASTPLPPRLAALTLGTLGLNERDVEIILHSPHSALVDEPVLLAAQAVLGVRRTVLRFTGSDDIVAIAAGLDRTPVASPPEHATDMAVAVLIVEESTRSTPPVTIEGTQPTTSSAPAPELVGASPQAEEPMPVPAPVESTAPEQSTPAPVENEEEQPEEVSQPPTEESSVPSDAPEQSDASPSETEATVEETPASPEPSEEDSMASEPAAAGQDDVLVIHDSAWTVSS